MKHIIKRRRIWVSSFSLIIGLLLLSCSKDDEYIIGNFDGTINGNPWNEYSIQRAALSLNPNTDKHNLSLKTFSEWEGLYRFKELLSVRNIILSYDTINLVNRDSFEHIEPGYAYGSYELGDYDVTFRIYKPIEGYKNWLLLNDIKYSSGNLIVNGECHLTVEAGFGKTTPVDLERGDRLTIVVDFEAVYQQ